MKIIYDVGSNNGDDLPYYLLKCDLVIAVEANPELAIQIGTRFAGAVAAGRLIVENVVITTDSKEGIVPFYIHTENHVLSQFTEPASSGFERVNLPSKDIVGMVQKYGTPHYIKIDIENYDHLLLRHIFNNKIFPPYISAESHSLQVFALLVALGGYDAFKLVDGPSVHTEYASHIIRTTNGEAVHTFPGHSAGPFGNDVLGKWQTGANFLKTLADAGLGWKDIHASNVDFTN